LKYLPVTVCVGCVITWFQVQKGGGGGSAVLQKRVITWIYSVRVK
jgi:hypothetical protein